MKKLMGLAAAVGMLCLAPAIASASIINFETEGTLDTDGCGSGCYTMTGSVSDYTNDVPGTTSWTFSGYMTFLGTPWLGATDLSEPTAWSFVDDSGSNNLSGTFAWALGNGGGAGLYNVTGGSGLFAGATGFGASVISITKWFSGLPEFYEVGSLSVTTPPPTKVSEPSPTGLVAVGLAMMGFAVYRRRRANVTRS